MIDGFLKTAGIACLFLALTAAAPRHALAQEMYSGDPLAQKARPAATSPGYIAMLYSKMLGETPDFEQWATASKSYGNAAKFNKTLAMREKALELRGVYDLLTPSEPIIVVLNTALSPYNSASNGFFIKNIKDDTFFSFNFLDRNYAVIPSNITDYQFLKMSVADGEKVKRGVNNAGLDQADLVLYIDPKFADKSDPLNLEGAPHWLLLGEVTKVAIYRQDSDRLLWESPDKNSPEAVSQELLNLKR